MEDETVKLREPNVKVGASEPIVSHGTDQSRNEWIFYAVPRDDIPLQVPPPISVEGFAPVTLA